MSVLLKLCEVNKILIDSLINVLSIPSAKVSKRSEHLLVNIDMIGSGMILWESD